MCVCGVIHFEVCLILLFFGLRNGIFRPGGRSLDECLSSVKVKGVKSKSLGTNNAYTD